MARSPAAHIEPNGQQTPTILVQESSPIHPPRNSHDQKDAPLLRPRLERGRQHSVQELISPFSRDTRAPTLEEQTPNEKIKTASTVNSFSSISKLNFVPHILHPPEAKPSHSVDIVVVYLFNGAKTNSDWALFEYHEQLTTKKDQSSKQEPAIEAVVDEGLPASPTRWGGNLSTLKFPKDTFIPKNSTGTGLATSSKPTSNADTVSPRNRITAPDRLSRSKTLSTPTINWLRDPTMLPKVIPEARVISMGCDIRDASNVPIDLEAAAGKLSESLTKVRSKCSTRPILFIGHGYGGIFIEQMLVNGASGTQNAESILDNTSGVFLFSCPLLGSDITRDLLARAYGISPGAQFFINMGTSSAKLRKLAEDFKQKALSKDIHPKKDLKSRAENASCAQTDTSRRTGFPIVQYVAAEEYTSQHKIECATENLRPDRPVDRLDDADSILVLGKDFEDMLKFPNPKDREFQRLTELISWAVHTRLLLDAAMGSQEDMESLLNNPCVNVNLRDCWGQTALHRATQRASNPVQIVRVLLLKGNADPSPKDWRLNTPLHYAVKRKDISLVRVLLDAKADVNAENDDLLSPIDLATRHNPNGRITKELRLQPLPLVEGPVGGFERMINLDLKPPQSRQGQIACRSFQVTATEIYSYGGTDYHWSLPISVQEMIYGPESLEDILEPVRPKPPKDVKQERPVCKWLHIHENNMTWVEDLFAKLGYGGSIWAGRGHTSTVPHSRSITPHVYDPRKQDNEKELLAIFVPYISYEVNKRQDDMSEFIREMQTLYELEARWRAIERAFLRNRPRAEHTHSTTKNSDAHVSVTRDRVGSEGEHTRDSDKSHLNSASGAPGVHESPLLRSISDMVLESEEPDSVTPNVNEYDIDEEDIALIAEYLNDPPSLHVRRTLDQYYYHMLPNTKQRDKDQVVTRWAKSKGADTHNIVMVDQLWLWHFKDEDGMDVIISSFPDRTGVNSRSSRYARSMDKLRDLVLDPIGNVRKPIEHPIDLVFRIIATCSNIFDPCQEIELLQFLQAFEISIGRVSNEETGLFKKFQNRSEHLHALDKNYKGFEDKKNNLLEQLLDIGSEIKLLVEIKDILDEINIILSILRTQGSILSNIEMGRQRFSSHEGDARRIIATSSVDFGRMQVQAEAVKNSLNALMDLKQKAANAWEAKSSREGAVATAKQGNTMLVFTIVTIIFLPLSFMSSFFALDVSSFPQDDKGQTNWPLYVVASLLFGISFAVSIPFTVIAFSIQPMVYIWKKMVNDGLLKASLYFLRILDPVLTVLKTRKVRLKAEKLAKRLQSRRDRYMKDQYNNMIEDLESSSDGKFKSSLPWTSTKAVSNSSSSPKDSDYPRSSFYRRVRRRLSRRKRTEDVEAGR